MSSPLSGFTNLPTPLKAGIMIGSGGGLAGATYLFLSIFEARVLWVIFLGLAVVALMLVGYKLILNWLNKRESKTFQVGMESDSAQKPGGISKAEHLARLDDLQRQFEEGIEKFRVAGKNLYSLPWVLIVGEPGSGKTEAVRHCNVGFPPGLHEPLQGTGGTVNMNWWFTDHAVILDTAGRLMFENVQAGKTTEWQHFLNLLKKFRRNCPINGVLLVIPADTLSTDTADEIEVKAEKIAQQFDMVKRTLDVRFPVFVVVTKTDRIDGFREFFDDIADPQLQHQILGWSNPAPLDEPFDPEQIDNYLLTIQKRLRRFRMGLLRDPVACESSKRRTDEVDALYAFPRQLQKIAPRLKRYLDLVFSVGGQWSGKPLFLRGIYFTSSMREGEALDIELAETLGVPVESLPDGKVWEKDRAYFLRDLFVNKVFRERGLVTRAANALGQHRRRKALVLGVAALSVVFLLVFTLIGAFSLKGSIGVVRDHFVVAQEEGEKSSYWTKDNPQMYWFPIVDQKTPGSTDYEYVGNQTINFLDDTPTRIQFLSSLSEQVEKGVRIPRIFLFARVFLSDIESDKLAVGQKTLFEAAALRPLVDAARWKIVGGADRPWTPQEQPKAAAALAQLIRMESYRLDVTTTANSGDQAKHEWLDPLSSYVLNDSDLEQFELDKPQINSIVERIYESSEDWPPELLSLHLDSSRVLADPEKAIETGVDKFIDYWKRQSSVEDTVLAEIRDLEDALKEYESAEQDMLRIAGEFERQKDRLDNFVRLNSLLDQWNPAYLRLSVVSNKINGMLGILADNSLDQAWNVGVQEILDQMQSSFAPLLNELPAEMQVPEVAATEDVTSEAEEPTLPVDNILTKVKEQLKTATESMQSEMQDQNHIDLFQQYQERYLAEVEQERLYQLRSKIWQLCQEQLTASVAVTDVAQLAGAIDEIDRQISGAREQIADIALQEDFYLIGDSAAASERVLEFAQRRRTSMAVNQVLASLPKSVDQISSYVENAATEVEGPQIMLTRFGGEMFDKAFSPDGAVQIFSTYRLLRNRLNDLEMPLLDRSDLELRFNEFKRGYDEYISRYYNYWSNTVPRLLESPSAEWKIYCSELSRITTYGIRMPLDNLGRKMEEAFRAVEGAASADMNEDLETALNHVVQNRKKNINQNNEYPIETEQWDKVLSNWSRLGEDSFAAAQKLNLLTTRDFRENFLIATDKTPLPIEFVDYYWYSMSRNGLRLLVQELETLRRESLNQLRLKCDRFPLSRPQPDDLRFMSIEDISQARQFYNRISMAGVDLTAENVNTALTGIKEIDDLLDRLRRPQGLSAEDAGWLEQIGKVLSVLPERPGEVAQACEVWLLDQDNQRRLLAIHQQPGQQDAHFIKQIWRYMSLKQGQVETDAATEIPNIATLGKLNFNSDGITFNFYMRPDSSSDRAISIVGPWAPLRLLHQGHTNDLFSSDQRQLLCTWEPIPPQQTSQFLGPGEQPDKVKLIKLSITGNSPGEIRWICLKLVFENPLPSPDGWPGK